MQIVPPRISCDCGNTKTDIHGLLVCLHCDRRCNQGCAKCRTYDRITSQRLTR